MITPSKFKRIENTCFNVNASGLVRGRNDLAKIYTDKNGNVTDCGKEYNVKQVVKVLFPS